MKGPVIPLSVAFEIASGSGLRTSRRSGGTTSRLLRELEHAERLKCLDNLARDIDPASRS